jgi:hypothetical protein
MIFPAEVAGKILCKKCPILLGLVKESRTVSALLPKADMCGAAKDVRYGPIADIEPLYSITSSARASSEGGIVIPRAFAVLRLITSSYFVGSCTGRSAGFSPLRMRST